jgi:beta-lactamase class A
MSKLSEEKAYDTFFDLDVLQLMLESDVTYVSISSYAKLYAILYNTGYLSKDMSQFGLQLLSEAAFRQGITAGVPKDVRVAHKFGFAVINGEGQLHDCGIVYHPKMAYTLCIMTTGLDQNKQNAAITELSHMVYDSVSKLDFE